MSKRFRNIFTILIIILLLVGVNLVVYMFADKDNLNAKENEIIYISNYSIDSVTVIEIDNKYGKVVLTQHDGIWYIEDDIEIELDQGVVSEIAYMLTHIVSERIVSDSVDKTNLYGMLTPAATITTHHDSVLEQSFIIGDKAPIDNQHYIQSSTFKKVYTLDSSYSVFSEITVEDLMTLNSVKIEHADMQKIDITNTLGQHYIIQRTSADNNISLCYWEFIEPMNHDADTAVLYGSEKYEGIITHITQIAGESILGYLDFDSNKYGQISPIFEAKIYNYSNQYQSFTIGEYGDQDNYSIVFSDDNIIYSISKERVPFIDYSAFFTADSNLNLINIDSVESVKIDLPDLKTQMSIDRYAVKNADGTEHKDVNGNIVYNAQITIEGLDESHTNANNLNEQKMLFYQYLTAVKIDNLIINDFVIGNYIGSIVFKLDSTYRDRYIVEFYEYSLTHYAARKNGETAVYLVNIRDVNNLIQKYDLLKTGILD